MALTSSHSQAAQAPIPEELSGLFSTYRGLNSSEIANSVLRSYSAGNLSELLQGLAAAVDSGVSSAAQLVYDNSRKAENLIYAPAQLAKEVLHSLGQAPASRSLAQYKDVSEECRSLADRAEAIISHAASANDRGEGAAGLVIECMQSSFRSVGQIANSRSVPQSSQALFHLVRAIVTSPQFSQLVHENKP